jgi:hypothetical protein
LHAGEQVAVDPIMERALGFILQFLGFLDAFRVSLTSVNRLVNTKKHTQVLREELTALQGSIFQVYSFIFYFIIKMFSIKLMCK